MKRLSILPVMGLMLFSILPIPTEVLTQAQPSARIEYLDYQYSDGWFTFTFTLRVENMRGQQIRVGLWGVDAYQGGYVQASSSAPDGYMDSDGNLISQDIVTPNYDVTVWDSFTLTVPVSAFNDSGIEWYPYLEVDSMASGANILSHSGYMEYLVIDNSVYFDSGSSGSTSFSGCDADSDCDGITDDLEMYLAESFMPVYEYDEEEHNPVTGSSGIQGGVDVVFLYQVSEVKCGVKAVTGVATQFILESKNTTKTLPDWIAESNSYLLTVVATYAYDYLPYDPGSGEDDRFNHYGDTERVRICIVEDEGNYVLRYLIINRHNEKDFYVISDIPSWEDSHPYLYVSEGKHATFVSNSECRGSNEWTDSVSAPLEGESWAWVGFREDCGGGTVIRPSAWKSFNVGEPYSLIPESGRTTLHDLAINGGWQFDLDPLGIEAVWSAWAKDSYNRDHFFCGGVDIADYSSEHNVAPGYDSPWCAGQLTNKWWDSSK